MRKTWVSSVNLLRIIIAIVLLSLLTACIEIPDRVASVRHEDSPILWLYEKEPEEDLAILYRKAPGEALQLIAKHVIPGSHQVHEDSLLFLDGANVLYYMSDDQGPHPLLNGIEPFSYGFVNHGRQVFAITENRELLLKTFGLEPQLLIDHVQHAVPLSDRLIALTDNGQVHAFDYYGTGMFIDEGAMALGATPDGSHAVIYLRSGATLVTNGKDARVVLETNGLGPIRLSRDGHTAAYLDHYDGETGQGTLMLLTMDEAGAPAVMLAEGAGLFMWGEDDCCLWFERDGGLYRYRIGDHAAALIQKRISQFDLLQNGQLAIITADGSLVIYDGNGEQFIQLSEEEPVEWIRPFASGMLYATESGITAYWDAERQREALGVMEHVLHDGQSVVGMRQDQALAWDVHSGTSVLLEDHRPYRYVYFDEQLLTEKRIQLVDIEGVWIAEDSQLLEIDPSGESKGNLVFDDGEPVPFYVIYSANDRLKLMIADLTNRTAEVGLQADGSLLLMMSDGWSKVYQRAQQDEMMPD